MDELEDRLRGIKMAEPPLGFDPDDVATSAARKIRNRRAVAATGTGTLAVIVAAMVALAPGSGPTLVSPATASSAPPVPQVQSPKVNLTAQKARNLQHLKNVVGGVLPGAKDIVVGDFAQIYADNDWDSITANVNYTDPVGKKRGFALTISGPAATATGLSLAEFCTSKPPSDGGIPNIVTGPDGKPLRCEKLPQARGGTVVIQEHSPYKLHFTTARGPDGVAAVTGQGTAGKITGRDATAFLADGSSVNVFDLGARGPDGAGLDEEAGPSLTDQQLLALVLDAGLTLK